MYIRTKDGVYENAHPYFIEDNKVYMRWDYPSNIEPEFLGDVINQSDTIEELCDEFVIDNWKERGKPVYCFKYVKETNSAYCIDGGGYIILFIPKMLECGCIIKGAIWTEWGLKYVAKMDNEGKLELI